MLTYCTHDELLQYRVAFSPRLTVARLPPKSKPVKSFFNCMKSLSGKNKTHTHANRKRNTDDCKLDFAAVHHRVLDVSSELILKWVCLCLQRVCLCVCVEGCGRLPLYRHSGACSIPSISFPGHVGKERADSICHRHHTTKDRSSNHVTVDMRVVIVTGDCRIGYESS